ncbi:hypothetical protein [Pseudomonas sp. GL-B-26]|uniref:hypothetical protein n=1 Tax=Pseudomonas sp. GL-B-26 TaxID=2832394 RepID=UPI001CBDB05E|nr:hypothetical protein [Pseudomonas sp. GL-B-26]
MDVLSHAMTVYQKDGIQQYNGVPCEQSQVCSMLRKVGAHVANLFKSSAGGPAVFKSPESFELSPDGAFARENPGDMIALIFEVVVEGNRNPRLWYENGDGGIDGEINTTIRKFLVGPATIAGNPAEGVFEKTYKNAKQKLVTILETRLPF